MDLNSSDGLKYTGMGEGWEGLSMPRAFLMEWPPVLSDTERIGSQHRITNPLLKGHNPSKSGRSAPGVTGL